MQLKIAPKSTKVQKRRQRACHPNFDPGVTYRPINRQRLFSYWIWLTNLSAECVPFRLGGE